MLTLQARGAFGFSEQAASIAVAARTGCDGRRTDSEDSHHATGMAIDDNPSDRDLAVNHSDVKVPIAGCHSLDQASESSADSSRPRTDARSMRKRRSGGTDSSAVLAAAARPGKVARAHDRIAAGGALASALPQAEAAAGASPGKKARMSWDTELHRSFLSALQKLGLRAAVPKTIMQEMGASHLSRENVASHLQKYRLALKRSANLSDNAGFDDTTWPLLEAAHIAHLASHGLAKVPAAPAERAPADATVRVSRAVPAPAQKATRQARSPAHKVEPAAAAAATAEARGGAAAAASPRSGLPPLPPASMPISAPFPQPPSSCAASGLPAGFALPAPNSAGEAVGVPVPVHMFPSSATPPPGPSARGAAVAGAQVASGAAAGSSSSLMPLALPERPASLMPSGFDAKRLQTCIAQAGGFLPSYGAADDNTCTVYMVNPAALSTPGAAPAAAAGAAANGFMRPAQVPQMMVAVSMAAYNPSTMPATAADGAPVAANSTGSAAVQEPPAQAQHQAAQRKDAPQRSSSQSESAGPPTPPASGQRRRTGLRRAELRRGSPVDGAAADSCTDEPLMFGSSNALDVLAEVAGKLAGEDVA